MNDTRVPNRFLLDYGRCIQMDVTPQQHLRSAFIDIMNTINNAVRERSDFYKRCHDELDRSKELDIEGLLQLRSQAADALRFLSGNRYAGGFDFPATNTTVLSREPIDPAMPNQDAAALVVRYFGKSGATTGDVFPELERAGHNIVKTASPRKVLSNALKAALNKGLLTKSGRHFFHKQSGGPTMT
jgi:hypothetical protein